MPIPKPTTGESKKEFIKRCMADSTMVSEYSQIDQRFAVCVAKWEER